MEQLIPVHIGLMGHIDHGKTALAQVLSERVSTAGLDKHPQAQQRGITIDLGFTMFQLDDKIVTLVDAPGHADLIRSVVAGATIIDGAILTVAADEGPMIQTGEHIVVLRSMGISNVVVAITKTDLVSEKRVTEVESKMSSIMSDAGYSHCKIVPVSALRVSGIEALKDALRSIEPKKRSIEGPLLMPIDHAFPIKGYGTVVTGTLLRGKVCVGDVVRVEPAASTTRVRTIQMFGEARDYAQAGDRVGINVLDISHRNLHRGFYLTTDDTLRPSRYVYARLSRNPYYKDRITRGLVVAATVGMPTVTAEIVPFTTKDSIPVVEDEVIATEFDCALLFQHEIAIQPGMRILLLRTDLPPTSMRIMATGEVTSVTDQVTLHRKKKRIGHVYRIREDDILVEELASSKPVAERLKGSQVKTDKDVLGVIQDTFGTRGVVSVKFDGTVSMSDSIIYERLVEEDYTFGH